MLAVGQRPPAEAVPVARATEAIQLALAAMIAGEPVDSTRMIAFTAKRPGFG